jgi:hypothetical protein
MKDLQSKETHMLVNMKAALAAVFVVASASVALADSVDGSPLSRSRPNPPTSVRGSPSILFEDRGVIGPLGSCMTDDAYSPTTSCRAGGVF